MKIINKIGFKHLFSMEYMNKNIKVVKLIVQKVDLIKKLEQV